MTMSNETRSPLAALYVYQSGKTCQYPDRKFAKLVKELKAGRGGAEITSLVENGYDEFLGFDGQTYCTEAMTLALLGH